MGAPGLVAIGPTTVEVSWKPPAMPNGIITQYRVHRKLKGQTGDGFLINILTGDVLGFTNRGADLRAFTEYEYRVVAANSRGDARGLWASVRTLEAPPQVLEPPKIDSVSAHSVTLSWSAPLQQNGVMLHYRIESRRVMADPGPVMAVRVPSNVFSAPLAGLSPYQVYELRIVGVNGAGEVTSSWARTTTDQAAPARIGLFRVEKMSTGRAAILRWDSPGLPNGVINNYIIYEDGNVNPLYQGLNRVFEMRKLQPYSGYTVWLEACTQGGCARSVKQTFTTAEIPPTDQPAPKVSNINATYVRLQWQAPVNAYGKITKYQVLRRFEALRRKRALSEPEVVYEVFNPTNAQAYEYVDNNLKPYTRYEYAIRTTNSQGSTDSPWQAIETLQAKPENLAEPILSHIGTEFDRVLVKWSPPASPNGILQNYRLRRNNSVPWGFSPSEPLEYIDTGLVAYTVYAYTVEACTGGGCTVSVPALIRTLQSKPLFVPAPVVSALNSTSLRITWTAPQMTNGQIIAFHLTVDDKTVYSGLALEFTAKALVPFRPYLISVSACTGGGCTSSAAVTGRPLEAPPESLAPPRALALGPRSIELSWEPPARPNGVITSYVLHRDDSLILESTSLRYVDYDVIPGESYAYTVTAYNSQGSVTSVATSVTTFASAPEGIAPPTLEALSSTSIRASWLPPATPNGRVYNYTLLNAATNQPVFSDNALTAVVSGLDHFTTYSFRVVACTAQGCGTSDAATVRTLAAPPLGLAPPRLTPLADALGAHAGVLVQWSPPTRPNAEALTYQLYRRLSTAVSPGNVH
jgi:usherin